MTDGLKHIVDQDFDDIINSLKTYFQETRKYTPTANTMDFDSIPNNNSGHDLILQYLTKETLLNYNEFNKNRQFIKKELDFINKKKENIKELSHKLLNLHQRINIKNENIIKKQNKYNSILEHYRLLQKLLIYIVLLCFIPIINLFYKNIIYIILYVLALLIGIGLYIYTLFIK